MTKYIHRPVSWCTQGINKMEAKESEIDLERTSSASEAPGSLGQMSMGNNMGFLNDCTQQTVVDVIRWYMAYTH